MKILCIGRNYLDHAKELLSEVPNEPVIFSKPDSAILKGNKPFYIPSFANEFHYEVEVLIKIARVGKNITTNFANRYYDEIGLGIDFTARDLQNTLISKGLPWEKCKAFDGSAVISDFIAKEQFSNIHDLPFHLNVNGERRQTGNTKDMLFSIDEIVAHASQFFTLKIGDIIFTGTPAGVGKININDRLEGYLADCKMLDFLIK